MQRLRRKRIRELTAGLGAMVISVVAVAGTVWVNIDHIERATARVQEPQEELAWADAVLDSVNDQDNALRGAVRTRDRAFVEPYQEGETRFAHALERLTAFAADDPDSQRADVEEARRAATAWRQKIADPQIAAVAAGRAAPPIPAGDDNDVVAIERAIDDLRAGQARLLQAREQTLTGAYTISRWTLLLGSSLALAFALLIVGRTFGHLIQERRLMEESAAKLAAALEGAQAAERAKVRFLANMSHEMRTPLNGVSGMTEILARTTLDPPQRELVDAIRFSATTLDHLIGDLLALARGEAPPAEERANTRFHLNTAVAAMARPFVEEAAAKSLAFKVEVGEEADLDVEGDADSLAEILACLLSNAVKFTQSGAVRLIVRRIGDDRFRFEVADTGEGFDEAFKARLFETFEQSDDSDTRRHGGAGLGLALAHRLTADMGGRLDARSTRGQGSVFICEIPLIPVAAAPSQPEPAESEGLRVLIVDDNPMNRKVLELILEQVGATWVSVADGQQAVDAVRAQSFDAILMDIQMPVMDGLTATRQIRRIEQQERRSSVPIIIVSANCQPEHIASGREAGAQRHLGKPVGAQTLIEALSEVLAQSSAAA